MPTKEILIIGGGIGGLTVALALAAQGRPVRLLEQAAEIAPIGYGIQLGPNVLPLFGALGIAQEVLAASHQPGGLVMLDVEVGELCRVPLDGGFRSIFEGRYLCIHRADLHDILLRAAERSGNITLESSATVVDFDQSAERVEVRTAEGASFEGSLLIAADGLKSRIREKFHPDDAVRQTGYVAHRTVLPMEDVPAIVRRDDVTLWVGPGYHVIYYPLRGGSELNVVAVFHNSLVQPGLAPDAYRSALLAHMADGQPEMRAVVALMDLERSWPIGDRDPIDHWSQGRVTLLGDSAHATLQSLAQGAGMAVEDAIVLAELLEEDANPSEVLPRFEAERKGRTARVQTESRDLWVMYHCAGRDRDVRNRLYRSKSDADFYECLAWLWHPISTSDEPCPMAHEAASSA